jgi:phenylacetate-CoA ligase
MNQFINPILLVNIAKSYLSDINRLWKLNYEQLQRYQDKKLRKMIRYAYSVPLYHEIYKENKIHPTDIKGIKDIKKLPLICKDELRRNYPDRIIPKNYNKENGFLISTSGSTGKPVFVFNDLFTAIKGLIGFARELKAFGGNWKKSRVALLIDLAPGSVEHASFTKSATPFLKKIMKIDNIKYIHVGEETEFILNELNKFQPEFIGSDPNMLRKLAYLKINGKADEINPSCLFSGGAMLDSYTKTYVKKIFGVNLYDTYGTTEGGPVGFECVESGNYHINSDFVFLEFLDKNDEPVPYGKPGKIVVTKLYGGGTPIIRYTGIEDYVIPIKHEECCGITSDMISHIEGRSIELIITPSGKMIAPLGITAIPAAVMDKFRTYKISQFQIIQHKIDEVEILVVIDEKLRNVGPSVEIILKELKDRFQKEIGEDVNLTIKEVKEIEKGKRTRSNIEKVVISKIKK